MFVKHTHTNHHGTFLPRTLVARLHLLIKRRLCAAREAETPVYQDQARQF
ncbi:MAG TPA: hypothetical protein VEI07_04210 [Planctomycetaceae bacterium]|nr:hypothetical protein [Planctomycetaceae bacterium]